jgi:hypothetical protein
MASTLSVGNCEKRFSCRRFGKYLLIQGRYLRFSEPLSEERFGQGDPLGGEWYGLGFALGVADEAEFVEAVHRVPVESLPRANLAMVSEDVEVKQPPAQLYQPPLSSGRLHGLRSQARRSSPDGQRASAACWESLLACNA